MYTIAFFRLAFALPLLLVSLASCSSGPRSETAVATPEGGRRYRFTYETRVPAPPPGTAQLRVWIPLPLDDPGVQSVGPVRVMAPGATVRETTEPKYGNRMLYVTADSPTGPLTISWSATITRWADVGQGTLPENPWFGRANDLIPIDGSARDLARKLEVDNEDLPVSARAQAVYDDVLVTMVYDKKHVGWGRGSFEHATTICMGNCTDFHARFIGTTRAGGISSRFTMGIPMKPGPGSYNSYHCWAHWHDGSGWQPVDISEADKIVALDPDGARRFFGHLTCDRLALTFGRDITLSPPQQGAPLNYFVFPYAEADDEALPLSKKDWTFSWIDV